ncbi:MAG: hydrogenase maturation protease [Pseudomonadota bacterium]
MKGCIICIGNRFVDEDAAGLQVFDSIQTMGPLPVGVELIEGGLAGLNLLPLLERGGRVVFVDAVRGYTRAGEIILLTHQEILQAPSQTCFDHSAGLPYLLAVLPKVCEGQLPEEIVLLGLEGKCGAQTIARAAKMSVAIAVHGIKDC